MPEFLMNFVHNKKINSFQKLSFLLFLYQHPGFSGTSEQFAEQLYLGDVTLMDRIIEELFAVGLLECANRRCRLRDDQSLKLSLYNLNQAYSDPLVRQKLLNVVKGSANFR